VWLGHEIEELRHAEARERRIDEGRAMVDDEIRLEREAAGFHRITFGAPDNPPFVEALWQKERLYFWTVAALLALAAVGVRLLMKDVPHRVTALALVAWVPAASFLGTGLVSLARKGFSPATSGSVAWWSLTVLAFVGSVFVARAQMNPA
jgi:hypothetical protein